MRDRVFVDTNVLIYAYDIDAGEKHGRAKGLLAGLWEADGGIISTQVLQEFYVNVTAKIPTPIAPARARGVLSAYRAWQVEQSSLDTILFASELQERHQLSFWDAMIVAAASNGGAETLLTEDLNHGQVIEGVRVRNPFVS
jgi:predicted nucleic acid-binding protein